MSFFRALFPQKLAGNLLQVGAGTITRLYANAALGCHGCWRTNRVQSARGLRTKGDVFVLCAHLLIEIPQCLPLAAGRQTLRNLLLCLPCLLSCSHSWACRLRGHLIALLFFFGSRRLVFLSFCGLFQFGSSSLAVHLLFSCGHSVDSLHGCATLARLL